VINYISNLPEHLHTGGFTAMNVAALQALRNRHDIRYVGPIDPPVESWRKVLSKFGRFAGLGGDYFFYSRSRLSQIAREVAELSDPKAQLDFFHGFTPWVMTDPQRPFVAWGDCTFRDYMDIFHRRGEFHARDLDRVEKAEALWMKRARAIVFNSRWAATRAQEAYGLDWDSIHLVGSFGDLSEPEADVYDNGTEFAFVSTNFITKGGPVVLDAFRRLREKYPDVRLVVAGDRGPLSLSEPGVRYLGFLRKEIPEQKEKLIDVFSRSRAIVNASMSDTAPVLLVEAAYFGCPAISSNRYAIPEIVEDGVTGILIDDPRDPGLLALAMERMLTGGDAYRSMRKAAWTKSRTHHSRQAFQDQLQAVVASVI
jgi:glycosyltransferase involved in cell wall biosynthesis